VECAVDSTYYIPDPISQIQSNFTLSETPSSSLSSPQNRLFPALFFTSPIRMQRLVYSAKLHHHPFPYLPQLGCLQPPNSGSFFHRLASARVNPFSIRRPYLQLDILSSNSSVDSLPDSLRLPDCNGLLHTKSQSVQNQEFPSIFLKAITVRKITLMSAITMILIGPLLTSPALASFPVAATAAAQTGNSVGRGLLGTEILTSAWAGFFAGCLHTLSGPDHLAALAPLSIGRTRMESAAVGALWGCGHDAGQVIFGLIFLLLKDRLHIEVLKTWGTRVVGFTLLVIGGMGIREASEIPAPCIALETGECDVSVYEPLENSGMKQKKKIGFATFATGIVHGLQPDALMMVLPALALPSRVAGAAFLFMFLFGTVVAMGGYTVFIGSCSDALKERVPRITEKLTWAASLVAIGLGLAIIVSQFFGFSLY
ncbi:hypothetical protein V2J09_021218, partial [Rumex salicifolius]